MSEMPITLSCRHTQSLRVICLKVLYPPSLSFGKQITGQVESSFSCIMSVLFSEKEVFLEMTLCLSTARLQSYIAYSELTSYAVLFQKNFNSIFVSLGWGGICTWPLLLNTLLNIDLNCQLEGNWKISLHSIIAAVIIVSRNSGCFVHTKQGGFCFFPLWPLYNAWFLDGGIWGHKCYNFLLHKFPIEAPLQSSYGFKNSSISSSSCFLLQKELLLPLMLRKMHLKNRTEPVPQRLVLCRIAMWETNQS